MIRIPGHLTIKTIHGRNGDFNVGRLAISIGEFVVKNAELDQYDEGRYEGDFIITEIHTSTYTNNGRLVVEQRARLGDFTLSGIDALSRDEAQKLTPQELDPIDEEAQAPVVDAAPSKPAKKAKKPDPLEDTAPFGMAPEEEKDTASDDAALFASLWPLGDVVKLDATVGRERFRQQRDRLTDMGYKFDHLTQDWHRQSS